MMLAATLIAEPVVEASKLEARARNAAHRVGEYIAAAETRGTWTPLDTAAIAADLDLMTPEDLVVQIARIGRAIEEGRITPIGTP